MDGTVRGLFTLVCMLAFVGLVFWAYSRRRKADFDEMAADAVPRRAAEEQGSEFR